MNIFNYFNKKKREAEQAKPIEPKVFTFTTQEICSVGDRYIYDVKANTKKEAFNKLVNYFFGDKIDIEDIKSYHTTVTRPMRDDFTYSGMPRWFAKRISGYRKENAQDYQKDLEKYANENNIKLKQY